jgi:hypothetical protein
MMLIQDCLNRCNPSTAEAIIALLVSLLLLRSDPNAERASEASSRSCRPLRDGDRDGGGVIRAMFDGPASHMACRTERVKSPRRGYGSIQAMWSREELVLMDEDDMSSDEARDR